MSSVEYTVYDSSKALLPQLKPVAYDYSSAPYAKIILHKPLKVNNCLCFISKGTFLESMYDPKNISIYADVCVKRYTIIAEDEGKKNKFTSKALTLEALNSIIKGIQAESSKFFESS